MFSGSGFPTRRQHLHMIKTKQDHDRTAKQHNDGAISRQTYVEMSYLIKDAKTEIERLKQEDLEAIAKQQELNRIDVFGGGE